MNTQSNDQLLTTLQEARRLLIEALEMNALAIEAVKKREAEQRMK